jgi:glycine betaine/choline ABC-type transport system substrate-binding protein
MGARSLMRRPALAWVGILGIAVSACRDGRGVVRVGSKNFTEQVVLGEIAAQALELRGVAVERRLDLGGTLVCHTALMSGQLDLYPEYTGTALTAILGRKPASDREAVRSVVAAEYARRWGLVWAPPLGFEDTFALVMRAGQAQKLGIVKISDLVAHEDLLRPGFGYEFLERPDGYPGLAAAYGLRFERRPAEMDLGLLYAALDQGEVDVVAGNSTDGLIQAMHLKVLEDDRRYFPPYEAAFVVRGAVWKSARVRGALEGLDGRIDAETMRRLNAAVDRDRRRPRDVAREFLAGLPSAGGESPP